MENHSCFKHIYIKSLNFEIMNHLKSETNNPNNNMREREREKKNNVI